MAISGANRVIVLGVDGLDPNILEKLMDAGELPAFSSIKQKGAYRRLATTSPPQSPVAWSTIATGSNPGYHGIFDFITASRETYLPIHSIVKVNPRNLLRRRASTFLPVRKGTAFWEITSRSRIPTTVVRWPVTFPPEQICGHMLSGLGVFDLTGSVGRYAFYTTGSVAEDADRKGDVIPVSFSGERIRTMIQGPDKSQVPMEISIAEEAPAATITIDGNSYTIKEREWSDWIPLRFGLGPLRRVSGSCRLYLDSVKPELGLYLSPIQVDPEKPAFPISYPEEYATDLAHSIGGYSTLGIPEDTNALSDGCLDDEAFLSLCNNIMIEREKMLWYELERFRDGLLAFVFDTTDRIQHIYWRTREVEHPAYDKEYAGKYQNVIEDYYRRVDTILRRVLESVDEQTVILIVSDHGFTSFRRAVHLNSWLVENGLMVLRKPARDDQGDPLFKNVLWERTRAYAVGFSSIYLNLRGREARGVVAPGDEAGQLKGRIAGALTSLTDPKTGGHVVRNVYPREDLFHGPYADDAPDLVVGFEPGYRASWQTAIGGAPPRILEDNQKRWSGDHIVDAACVPGIFLANRRVTAPHPRVIDIAPTVLRCFQISQPADMEGNSLLD